MPTSANQNAIGYRAIVDGFPCLFLILDTELKIIGGSNGYP